MTRARRAFTLVEVITAITLTAIVLTIAAAALAAASDSRDSIQQHRETLELESRWRAITVDMLRHAPPADAVDEPLLRIERTSGSAPTLTILSTGVVQPFGTGRIWRVTLGNSANGMSLDAEPVGRGGDVAGLHTELTHVRLLDVAVRDDATGHGTWRGDWPVERTRPPVVRLMFAGTNGIAVTPLYVDLAPMSGPAR